MSPAKRTWDRTNGMTTEQIWMISLVYILYNFVITIQSLKILIFQNSVFMGLQYIFNSIYKIGLRWCLMVGFWMAVINIQAL